MGTGSRIVLSLILLACLSGAACSYEDNPFGEAPPPVQADAADPLEPPFLCLVPTTVPEEDAEAWVRSMLEGPPETRELALVRTPGGVTVARTPMRPAEDPPVGVRFSRHRRNVEPAVRLLESLPADVLTRLVQGELVVLTPWRDDVREALTERGILQTGSDLATRLDSSPCVLAVLSPRFAVDLATGDGKRLAVGLCATVGERYLLTTVQLGDAGAVAWEPAQAEWDRRQHSPEWLAAPRWTEAKPEPQRPALRDLAQRAGEGGDATVNLSEVSGMSLTAFLSQALSAPEGAIQLVGEVVRTRLFARGGDVPLLDMLDAVQACGARPITPREGEGPLLVVLEGGSNPETARRSAAFAAERDPSLTERVLNLVGQCVHREHLPPLPMPLERFLEGWAGAYTDLDEAQRRWVGEALADYVERFARTGEQRAAPEWLDEPEALGVSCRVVYGLTIGICAPYGEPSPGETEWRAPPPVYCDDMGADPDRPFYQVISVPLVLH